MGKFCKPTNFNIIGLNTSATICSGTVFTKMAAIEPREWLRRYEIRMGRTIRLGLKNDCRTALNCLRVRCATLRERHLTIQRPNWADPRLRAMPPLARIAALVGIGEAVLVQLNSQESRRTVRERIAGQQVQHFRFAAREAHQERLKPGAHQPRVDRASGRVDALQPQRFKPHLPIEPRLMRRVAMRGAAKGRRASI